MKRFLSLFLCFAIAVSCFCFATVSADANLSTDKSEYGIGEAIMVTATGSGTDWVGIYKKGETPSGTTPSIFWYYVADYGSGNAVDITKTTSGDRGSIGVGEYTVMLLPNDGYGVAASVDISVVEVDNSSTTYDFTINGQAVEDGELLTFTNGDTVTLEPTANGAAGDAWIGVYYAYYNKLTPYQSASGNMQGYEYVSAYNGSSWNITSLLWSGRSTIVLFGDGGYSKVLKVIQIQLNGYGDIDFALNGKEVANNAKVTLYKGYESAVLNMSASGAGLNGHGNSWYTVYNDVAGSSEIDYSGYGYGDWDYVSSGDKDITSKLKEGKNTVVVYGNEKYNDIRKCIVIDYVTPDFNVDIDTLEAASIRLNNPTGIRFYSTVDADKIAELVAHGATVEAGTLIGPADMNADAMTLETDEAKIVNVVFNLNNKDGYFTDNTGFEGIVGSIVNINSGNISRDFVGRGYVKVTYNGVTTVSYSDTVSTRSLRTVAQSCQLDTAVYDSLSENIKTLVDAWASAPDFE